jgi:hypothetical protein
VGAYTLPIVVTRKKMKKVTRKLRERYSQTNSGKFPRPHCTNNNLFAAVNKKFNAIFLRGTTEIFPRVSVAAAWTFAASATGCFMEASQCSDEYASR